MASTSRDARPSPIYFCNMMCGKPFLNDQEFEEHKKNHKSRRTVMSELKKRFPAGTAFRSTPPPTAAPPANTSTTPPAKSATSSGHSKGRSVFPCTVCDKVFTTKKHQARHIRIHTGEKPYACPTCGRAFSQEASMKRHERIHLGDARERNYTCDICHKAYEYRFYLAQHMKSVHNGERPHKCSDCDKAFFTREKLHVHRMTHTGYRPYVCNVCNRGFTQPSRLKSHQVVHDPSRHVCETCGKSFNLPSMLAQHRKLHAMKIPFSCDICKQVFSTRRGLKNHKNTHNKPFLCEGCGKAFSLQTGLKKHLIRCHKTKKIEEESQNSDKTDEDTT